MTLWIEEFCKYSDLQETVRWWEFLVGKNKLKIYVSYRLKKLYKGSTVVSSIFFDEVFPVVFPGMISLDRSLSLHSLRSHCL